MNINIKKLEELINKKKNLPEELVKELIRKIFTNIFLAVLWMVFFFFLSLGFVNIGLNNYIVDLKVFSILILAIAIYIFEYAYKKDNDEIAIYGIETLVIAIFVLFLTCLSIFHAEIYINITITASFTIATYYIVKSLIIYIKAKRKIHGKSDKKKGIRIK